MNDEANQNVRAVRGSCHCGRVRFSARVDLAAGLRCNCSICTKLGAFVAPAEPGTFQLESGSGDLTDYRFGARALCRRFCKHCGILCFALGREPDSGAEQVNVNLNALDDVELKDLPAVYFDGRHDNFETSSSPWPVLRRA